MMLMTTTDVIPGRSYAVLGLVMGSFVNSKDFVKDIGAGLKSLVGGELKSYTRMMEESRQQALTKLESEARALGADAVIGVRFTTSAIMQGASEILATGTAIKFQ
ncbi:MAG: YbjQ family protein [Bacillota bacterium]